MSKGFSRRFFVKFAGVTSASAAGAAIAPGNHSSPNSTPTSSDISTTANRSLIPAATAQDSLPPAAYRTYEFFTPEEALFVEAVVDRLIPSDSVGPGALELGAAYYIDRQMTGIYGQGDRLYLEGSFQQGASTQGYQLPLRPREIYRIGISDVDQYCRNNFSGQHFSQLSPPQQETVLSGMESGEVELETIPAQLFFNHLLQNTTEGYFCDPIHGGNRDMGSWTMLGFPGARATFIEDVGRADRVIYPPVSLAQIVAQSGIQ